MLANASALSELLNKYRTVSQTEREKGSYFEELIQTYLRYEASYKSLFSDVWLYADWAKYQSSQKPTLKPKYPRQFLPRVITVYLETNKTVANLPKLEID